MVSAEKKKGPVATGNWDIGRDPCVRCLGKASCICRYFIEESAVLVTVAGYFFFNVIDR